VHQPREYAGMIQYTTSQLPLLLSRDVNTAGDRATFYGGVRRGELVAVVRGAYVSASGWANLDRHDRQRLKSAAVNALAADPLLFSHASAAALWRLPRAGAWLQKEHALVPIGGLQSTRLVTRHESGFLSDVAVIDGLNVTGLARTVVDVAATHAFGEGVVAADAALHRAQHPHPDVPLVSITKDDLLQSLALLDLRHGSARARRTIDFADGLADRPGESLSRVTMHLAKLPTPELQVVLYGASGRRYIVDFWWPGCRLIGEFDGEVKYQDPEFLRGRTPHQVLIEEKKREDDLRAAGYRVTRWDMATAVSAEKLRTHLMRAGLK